MTAAEYRRDGKKRRGIPTTLRVAAGVLFLFLFLLILKNPRVASALMRDALGLCAKTVIPSLFPFMVISEIMVSGGGVRRLSSFADRPSRALLGMGGEGAVAALMGIFCGLPIGARCGAALYRTGRIDRRELSRILIVSSNPSSAFLVGAVGSSMFGDQGFGALLYVLSVVSSLMIGIFLRLVDGKALPTPENDAVPVAEPTRKGGIALFTSAVTSSALAMLNVCAFVVFFSTLVGVLEFAVSAWELPDSLSAFLFGFFEMTAGMNKAASLPRGGEYIAAFIAGFTGLSAQFQVMSAVSDSGIPFRTCFFARLCAGAICTLATLAAFSLGTG